MIVGAGREAMMRCERGPGGHDECGRWTGGPDEGEGGGVNKSEVKKSWGFIKRKKVKLQFLCPREHRNCSFYCNEPCISLSAMSYSISLDCKDSRPKPEVQPYMDCTMACL